MPRLDKDLRRDQMRAYESLVSAMEMSLGVPVDYKQGVISNIMWAGFEDEVNHGFKLELGIELNKPPAYDGLVSGEAWYNAHEAGHGRTLLPPTNFGAIGTLGEAYATLTGLKGGALMYRGEEYIRFHLGYHDFFLRHLHGAPLQNDGDEIETMQFLTNYINAHYGWTPHRRMILEWSNTFLPLRTALQNSGQSDMETFATIYSWICDSNLGLLFDTAGFAATETAVADGLAVIDAYQAGLEQPVLTLGTNTVRTAQTSIAVGLATPLTQEVRQIAFTLDYDPLKMRFGRHYKRDLTSDDSWQFAWLQEVMPGQIVVMMEGSEGISGPGSLAQFNFSILPGVSGPLPFMLSGVTIDDAGRPGDSGELASPVQPVIGPFPTLPSAMAGVEYSTLIWAIGGASPCEWAVVEDNLPPGLSINTISGEISGIPSEPGEYLFRVRCINAAEQETHRWFTTHVTDTTHFLDVIIEGSGTVSSVPNGIDCPESCSHAVAEHTVVYLTATPGPFNEFIDWSGSAECSDGILVMDEPHACTATFGENVLTGIDIEKHTNGEDADEGPVGDDPTGPLITFGEAVTWEYFVENTGEITLTGITVIDDQGTADESDDVIVDMPGMSLQPGEQMTGSLTGSAIAGQYANTAHVTGKPPQGLESVSDSDSSHYFGVNPAITIEKQTNGEDADLAPGPLVTAAESVTWQYHVENTGNITLTGIMVIDDQGTAEETDDVVIQMPTTTLRPGEQMTGSLDGSAVAGQYANLATVTASSPVGADITDSDHSHYFGKRADWIFKSGFE
jgi:hypothetical protein